MKAKKVRDRTSTNERPGRKLHGLAKLSFLFTRAGWLLVGVAGPVPLLPSSRDPKSSFADMMGVVSFEKSRLIATTPQVCRGEEGGWGGVVVVGGAEGGGGGGGEVKG